MDIIRIILRTIFFYIFIIITFRIMGKREVGQLSVQDLVVNLLIAELASISIEKFNDPIIYTIIPITLLLFLEIITGLISIKSNKFRNLLDGKPSLIINRGIINYKEMIKQRYNLSDLMIELRNNKIKDIRDIEYAILENNGKLNIYKYSFLGLNKTHPFPLILDGVIQKDTLNYIEKDEKWLIDYLNEKQIKKENIFYAFYKNKNIYIIKRNELNIYWNDSFLMIK